MFSKQELEQLKAARVLFAKLAKDAAWYGEEWADEEKSARREGRAA